MAVVSDKDTIYGIANQFQKSAQDFEGILSNMRNQVNSLDPDVWAGDAKNQFDATYEQLEKKYKEVKETIDDIDRGLKHTADTYEAADQQAARGWNV